MSARRKTSGFTLIEIMLVIFIMGIVMLVGVPAIYRMLNPPPLAATCTNIQNKCSMARARAIFGDSPMEVRIFVKDRRVDVVPLPRDEASPATDALAQAGGGNAMKETYEMPTLDGKSPKIPFDLPADVSIDMVAVNFAVYTEVDFCAVRFYPNGTSDDLTLILRSTDGQYRKVTVDPITGLATIEAVQ
jgi:prepilin-type N-terminal cleavage/methylation domain-containing protein